MTYLVRGGLLITPEKKARDGWKEAIEGIIAIQCQEPLDNEWLDSPLTEWNSNTISYTKKT